MITIPFYRCVHPDLVKSSIQGHMAANDRTKLNSCFFCPTYTQEERNLMRVGIGVGLAGMVRGRADPRGHCSQDASLIQKRKEHQKKWGEWRGYTQRDGGHMGSGRQLGRQRTKITLVKRSSSPGVRKTGVPLPAPRLANWCVLEQQFHRPKLQFSHP